MLLWMMADGLYAKRLCQGRIYWESPLAPYVDKPNKLEKDQPCKLFDTQQFLIGEHRRLRHAACVQSEQLFLKVWYHHLDQMVKEISLALICLIQNTKTDLPVVLAVLAALFHNEMVAVNRPVFFCFFFIFATSEFKLCHVMDPTDHICSCSHGFYKWKKQEEQNKIHISHKFVHSFTVCAVFN